ncbi:translational GTPase TypA [Puniceicoccus vermicola]|uniref:Large ribosomal subunit assembly factor BipA n=1 Tax=Puniceicoccus vermicola TaxID=388746 RepID=A0A7X1E2N3_9BACT|nr:translational GTPase TypA [Puniceicoccus vermicola]MBC2600186.1 translational GTPase TypA [Puniceicoccus vermicola]
MQSNQIRNVAIIAHVDHGKTTLVDQLLRQGGAFRDNQVVSERVMDSMDLEREKGITIKAKNTAIIHEDHLVNIVDTPGHADFGAEVERVMKMVDGVLLLVDAYEGPQAQTRFVLRKALAAGLSPVIVINKVDRENARPEYVHDKVLELFLELEATEEQFNAPFIYASARDGWAALSLDDPRESMAPLFKIIRDSIPAPEVEEGEFRMLVSNIDWNDFVGRIAVGRILSGSVKQGQTIWAHSEGKAPRRCKITKLFTFTGITTEDSPEGVAGDIVGLAGFEDIGIGDTLAFGQEAELLPFVAIDPPTIQMEFAVNDGPFAGREGKKVTSRQIRERLIRETQSNISIKIEDGIDGGSFLVTARGAMQISVLLETMRREGYEVLVSRPTVVFKEDEDGKKLEPFETLWIELPDGELGGILEMINRRKGIVVGMDHHNSGVTVEAEIPTRGVIGLETDLVNLTSGTGVMSHLFLEYRPFVGVIDLRLTGTLVSMDQGAVMAYALDTLQQRGRLFVAPGEEVYGGQVVGENPRKNDLPVNPTKAKQLDNIRSSGDGKGIQLTPPVRFSLERALEYIAPDELVEVTPAAIRLRKRILDSNERRKAEKRGATV